ncbi:MAG: glycosyltransferase family 2 protein [bacterium]|nr:glycosyltransferase family 2 protein [bacterium]
MSQGKNVSVVVSVFNEEKTVANVVRTILDSKLVSEVVCVNDGSVDRSLEILKGFGDKIKLMSFPRNRGKGAAMAEGIRCAHGSIILFLDADLLNLTAEHLSKLISPLLNGKAEIVIGRFSKAPLTPPQLSGQRAYWKKDLLPFLTPLAEVRFGAEVFLNYVLRKKKKKTILLKNVSYLKKQGKVGLKKAAKLYLDELMQIINTMGKIENKKMEKIGSILGKEVSLKEIEGIIEQLKGKEISQKLMRYFTYLREYFSE